MNVEVNTSEYQFSHGHLPRGRGYWAFQVGSEVMWSSPEALYTHAVSAACRLAKQLGVRVVRVLP